MKFTIHPEYSRARVNAAGQAVRDGNFSDEDEKVIENWRASHAYVLNTFQATLRRHASGRNITIAQRLKRRSTIFNKLIRHSGMNLARMHDLAGCRVIFDNIEELESFRKKIHSAKFKHEMKNNAEHYDYILSPKDSGYRGIHDVYSYKSYANNADRWNGLLIEIQYRTKTQHAWATAVEIAGSITGNEPKFDRGDKLHKDYFKISSELFSRKYEGKYGSLPTKHYTELIEVYREIEKQTNLSSILDGMHISSAHFKNSKNLILMIDADNQLSVMGYTKTSDALNKYKELEQSDKTADIVLVRADSHEAVRSAFRNYFSDTKEYIKLLQGALKYSKNIDLSGPKAL